ncbi:MAG: KOW domain-containing RNA-binding protein [Clostridia bacterium]|nr:KOW domain-containing RNA-binding protein [Clostridia bacterium]
MVRSLAGHDKGQLFLVVRREGKYLFLCDGKQRKVIEPKKKKEKHVVGTGVICPWVETQPEKINNTSVRAAMKQLLAESGEVK